MQAPESNRSFYVTFGYVMPRGGWRKSGADVVNASCHTGALRQAQGLCRGSEKVLDLQEIPAIPEEWYEGVR